MSHILQCISSKLFVIDQSGSLHLLDTEGGAGGAGGAVRRDVWGARWADNAPLLAVAEKARLYVLRDGQPEEPLVMQGYLCRFKVSDGREFDSRSDFK